MKYSKDVAVKQGYDVLVAGGGPAGIGAAVAAGREGLKTLLVESNGMLGGVSTAGALPFCLGKTSGSIPFLKMVEQGLSYENLPHPMTAVAGLFDEIISRIKQEGGGVGPCKLGQTDQYPGLRRLGCHDEFTFDLETGKRVLDEVVTEAGVDILFYTQALDVSVENNQVQGVYLVNKDGMTFVPVKAVIDCTGDADLISRAGYLDGKKVLETTADTNPSGSIGFRINGYTAMCGNIVVKALGTVTDPSEGTGPTGEGTTTTTIHNAATGDESSNSLPLLLAGISFAAAVGYLLILKGKNQPEG